MRKIPMSENMTRIDKKCIEAGISRKELAQRSGIPYVTIDQWARRKRLPRDVYALAKVAKALGCQIEDLIEPEPEEPLIHGENLDAMARRYGLTRENAESDAALANRIKGRIAQINS